MRQRKLANWVARAIRLAQVLGRTDAAGRQEADNLVSKLQLGQRPSWLQLQELIQDRSSQLGEAEATDRRLRLQDWRRAMLQDPARRKRWLQKPSKVCVPDVVFEDATLRTDEDIVEAIASYCQHTWRAAAGISQRTGPEASVSRPASTGAACRSAPGPTAKQDFAGARKAVAGAAGPDGWTPSALKALPEDALEVFQLLTARWEQAGHTPTGLQHARQVNQHP